MFTCIFKNEYLLIHCYLFKKYFEGCIVTYQRNTKSSFQNLLFKDCHGVHLSILSQLPPIALCTPLPLSAVLRLWTQVLALVALRGLWRLLLPNPLSYPYDQDVSTWLKPDQSTLSPSARILNRAMEGMAGLVNWSEGLQVRLCGGVLPGRSFCDGGKGLCLHYGIQKSLAPCSYWTLETWPVWLKF